MHARVRVRMRVSSGLRARVVDCDTGGEGGCCVVVDAEGKELEDELLDEEELDEDDDEDEFEEEEL